MATDSEQLTANKALVLLFMDYAHSGQYDRMAECLAADYAKVFPRPGIPGMPAGTEGRDRIIEFMQRLPAYQPGSLAITIEHIIAEGDWVAVQFSMKAITAAGEPYENFYMQFVECRDGRIVKSWEYCDTLYAAGKLLPKAKERPGHQVLTSV